MKQKEQKSRSEFVWGLVIGIDIIAITWVLLIIPALLIQVMGIKQDSSMYSMVMAIFQIIAGILATFISIKITKKSCYLANNKVSEAILFSTISTVVLLLVNAFVLGGLLPIIPFNNILGAVIMIAVYGASNFLIGKKLLQ